MSEKSSEWLEREVDTLVQEGLISESAREKIKERYKLRKRLSFFAWSPVMILVIIGMVLASIGACWLIVNIWYNVSMTVRLAFAGVLLVLSQSGIFAGLIQGKQAQLSGEIACLVHYLTLFMTFAVVEQTFYIGWDRPAYIATCAILGLPAVYILRSIGGAVVYALALLLWAAAGGMINAPLGVGSVWLMLILMMPLYGVFYRHGDEVRLSLFAWLMTITVYAVFAMVMIESDYIPFLVLGTLAVVMMLTGYSIDIRKAYGTPFRWFGRIAAMGALVISTVPSSWFGIADIKGFHWSTTGITVLLFFIGAFLFLKRVKKRFWAPAIYAAIPVLLGIETLFVRSGIYSSLPLVLSFVVALFISFYEIVQGLKPEHMNHLRFGVVALLFLIVAVIGGNTFSPFVPVAVVIIAALTVNRVLRLQEKSRSRGVRFNGSKTVTAVRNGSRGKNRKTTFDAGPATLKGREPDMPEWMRTEKSAATVVTREAEKSQFIPPVFHSPESVSGSYPSARRTEAEPVEKKRSGSPWATTEKDKRKEKKEPVRSPWSDEGGLQ